MAEQADRAGTSTHDLVIQLLERFDNMESRLEETRHVVFGNGEPGLKGQVAALVTGALAQQWFLRALAIAIMTPIVAATVVGTIYLIKHLP